MGIIGISRGTTPFFDGTTYVSQYSVKPGKTLTYRFVLDGVQTIVVYHQGLECLSDEVVYGGVEPVHHHGCERAQHFAAHVLLHPKTSPS